jgi:uncharacterized protein (TIGR02145 family)
MRAIVSFVLLLSIHSFAAFVAVLETVSIDKAITPAECRFLTDELRAQAGAALPSYMNYTIMTRENINVMLPPGKSIEDCEGSCIAETGRNIAADYVAQARVGRFEDRLTLTVELYATGTGNLIGSFTAMQTTAVDLWNSIKADAKSMFAKVQNVMPAPAAAAEKSQSEWETSPLKNGDVEPRDPSKPFVKKYIKDPRDGRTYKVVVIGKKAWMAENLRYDAPGSECHSSDDAACRLYGRYYTWAQALNIDPNCNSKTCAVKKSMFIKGICPAGWHIPSIIEWQNLSKYVQGKAKGNASLVLKSDYGWKKNNGTNESRFNAVPAGFRFGSGNFMDLGKTARFWSTADLGAVEAVSWEVTDDFNNAGLTYHEDYKVNELSVRCVSDE